MSRNVVRNKLYKWIKEMGYDSEQAAGILDNIYKKLLPYASLYGFNLDSFLGNVISDTSCINMENFRKIINSRIKRKAERMKGNIDQQSIFSKNI